MSIPGGVPELRRTPIQWVPKLEGDDFNEVFGLTWGDLKIYGNWKDESLDQGPEPDVIVEGKS